MADRKFRKGFQVYTADDRYIGDIEDVNDNGFMVGGQTITTDMVERTDGEVIYLTNAFRAGDMNTAQYQNQNELRVPEVEERLRVGKQATQTGEVDIHKRVTTEQQSIPVELRHEEVHVEHHNTNPERPLTAEEANNAFQEGTMRVPLRGEQAVVQKEAVVTGEAVVRKDVQSERQEINDSVRKERVEVDENAANYKASNYNDNSVVTSPTYSGSRYEETTGTTSGGDSNSYSSNPDYATGADMNAYSDKSTDPDDNAAYATGTTKYSTTDPNDTSAYTANPTDYSTTGTSTNTGGAIDYTTELYEDMEVISADGEKVGKVKEADGNTTFRVSRGLFKGDVNVSYTAIQNIHGDQVILNVPKEDFDSI